MTLEDKHREFAVKCYAKFMNTNATIVFQFINYGGGTRSPRQIMPNTIRGIMLNTHTRQFGDIPAYRVGHMGIIPLKLTLTVTKTLHTQTKE